MFVTCFFLVSDWVIIIIIVLQILFFPHHISRSEHISQFFDLVLSERAWIAVRNRYLAKIDLRLATLYRGPELIPTL